MTKINMAELIADREAGTEGPWVPDDGFVLKKNSEYSCGEELISSPWYADYHGFDEYQANARRIARLPDLEAAYIEAVEIVKALMDTLPPVATDEKLAAVGRAKAFLKDHT